MNVRDGGRQSKSMNKGHARMAFSLAHDREQSEKYPGDTCINENVSLFWLRLLVSFEETERFLC